jgi:hypothetical protein
MVERNDEALLRGAALEQEGISELEDQPASKILTGETPEGIIPPRDYPLGAEEYGTTAAEEAIGETVAQRVAREEPDLSGDDVRDDDERLAGRLVQPDAGMADADDTAEELGYVVPDVAGLSAEEAAVRIETDPEGLGGGWPGYLDEDGPV